MKKIHLTPYPGFVIVTRTRAEHAREFKKMFGYACDEKIRSGLTTHTAGNYDFLVYAKDTPSLVHELSHVVLDLFQYIRSEPVEGNGEPFAYLMGYLFKAATAR